MTLYPDSIDSPLNLPDVEGVSDEASAINDLRDAVVAIETELGVKPSGIYSDVASRLSVVEARVSSGGGGGGGGGLPSGSAGGDLAGSSYPNPTVSGIRGRPVSGSAPSSGQSLVWNGSAWAPGTVSGFTAGTDLSGNSTNQTVIGIRGKSLNSALATIGSAQDGYALTWNNSSSSWQAIAGGASVAGDIAKTGTVINLVKGFNSTPFDTTLGANPPTGGTWVYNGTANKFHPKKPVMPGHWDLADFGGLADRSFGRTGSIISGSSTLTVNDASNMFVGQKLYIAGVSGTKEVASISGTTITLTTTAGATVSGASVMTDNADAWDAIIAVGEELAPSNRGIRIVATGDYFFSRTLHISRQVFLEGTTQSDDYLHPGTVFAFPANTTGLRIHSASANDEPGSTSHNSVIENITILCLDKQTTGHAVHASCRVYLNNVYGASFAENGLNIVASTGSDQTGNASNSQIINCRWGDNGRHGIFIDGGDASICLISGGECVVNNGWGIVDASGLGNAYIGVHCEGNLGNPGITGSITTGTTALTISTTVSGTDYPLLWVGFKITIAGVSGTKTITAISGNTVTIDSPANATVSNAKISRQDASQNHDYATLRPTNASLFVGCYSESAVSFINTPSMAMGGYLAMTPNAGNAFILSNATVTGTPINYSNPRGTNQVNAQLGESPSLSGMGILKWEIDVVGSPGTPQDSSTLHYMSDSQPWVLLANGSDTREVIRFPTQNGAMRRPAPWLTNGIYLGREYIDTPVIFSGGASPRSSDGNNYPISYEVGDFVLNTSPTQGAAIGSRAISAGTLDSGNSISGLTATTTSSSTSITLHGTIPYGALRSGMYITIAGVSGTKKIVSGFSGGTGTDTFIVDVAASAAVTGAAAALAAPVFESVGVGGFNGIPFNTSIHTSPPTGGTWVYNDGYIDGYLTGSPEFLPKKSVMSGYYDVEDFGAVPDYNSGRTGSITTGTSTLIVSDASKLNVGRKIAIAGVTGTKKITAISGTTITLDSTADATVASAAVYTDNWDAFNTALAAAKTSKNATHKIIFSGWFYLGQTLIIDQSVHLIGSGDNWEGNTSKPGAWLLFPKNVHGIYLQSSSAGDPLGAGNGAGRSWLKDFTLTCIDSSTTSGHGIYASAYAMYEGVTVSYFGGDGFHLYANTGTGSVDCSQLLYCYSEANKGDGFYIYGNEANACTVNGCTAFVNTGNGFTDHTGYGSTGYFGCHSEGNSAYQYDIDGNASLFHCYGELSGLGNRIGGTTSVIGGFMSVPTNATTFRMVGGAASNQPVTYVNARGPNRTTTILGEYPYLSAMAMFGWTIDVAGQPGNPQDNTTLCYIGDSTPWVSLQNNSVYREVVRFPTVSAHARRPAMWATNGIFIGDISSGNTPGTPVSLSAGPSPSDRSGDAGPITHEVGDFTLNSTPTANSAIGFRCLTAGTLAGFYGVGSTLGAITSGTTALVVSGPNVGSFAIGQYIAIAGVTGTKKITAWNGTTITIDSVASATVSGAAVTFVAPTFESVGVIATGSVIGSVKLAGDLAGSASSPTVAKINGNAVATQTLGSAQDGYFLTWDNADGYWLAKSATAGFTAGGDLTGTSTSQVVAKIHGATVPIAGSLTTGNVLQVNGSSSLTYSALNLAGGANYVTGSLPTANQASQSMGGDVSGTTASATVAKVNGATVPISGSLTTGNVLQVSGTSALTYGALNLAGGANFVTGVLPIANQASQTVAGDVTGTTAVNVVTKIRGNNVVAQTMTSTQDGYVLTWSNVDGYFAARKPDRASNALAALAIDWSISNTHSKTLSAGSNTFTFSNATDGQCIIVVLTGAASTVVWPTVKWPAGVAPTQTASGTDVYTFTKVGLNIYGSVVQAMA
jgi:hypothetical protein